MDLKYCKQCDSRKERTEFYNSSRAHDGLRAYCIPCCKNPVRKQRETLATPAWTDIKKLNRMKRQRTKYNKDLGLNRKNGMTIGHIIPIHGIDKSGNHIVCGLNIPQNISAERADENYSKGHRTSLEELNQVGRAA